ncbi:hypothetical protein AVEN_128267-1 [Araneus ventricosus]|uniref:Uncharacterized protein n=1 Tax=Araneus ventricosus TaxID=182803 RepID=A0A4Y2FT24_ARAVE|nr:hypothetical protein AVEN_128267-1 [Araneus ventricosus]
MSATCLGNKVALISALWYASRENGSQPLDRPLLGILRLLLTNALNKVECLYQMIFYLVISIGHVNHINLWLVISTVDEKKDTATVTKHFHASILYQ